MTNNELIELKKTLQEELRKYEQSRPSKIRSMIDEIKYSIYYFFYQIKQWIRLRRISKTYCSECMDGYWEFMEMKFEDIIKFQKWLIEGYPKTNTRTLRAAVICLRVSRRMKNDWYYSVHFKEDEIALDMLEDGFAEIDRHIFRDLTILNKLMFEYKDGWF